MITVAPAYQFADVSQLSPIALRETISGWPTKVPYLVFVGPPGRGKTHAAYALLKHVAAQGIQAYLLDCKEARTEFLAETYLDARKRRVDTWKQRTFTILDSFADAAATDGWKQAMLDVLDYRINNNLPTVLVTKASGSQLNVLFGNDLVSRLNFFTPVIFDGRDRRKKEPEEPAKEAA